MGVARHRMQHRAFTSHSLLLDHARSKHTSTSAVESSSFNTQPLLQRHEILTAHTTSIAERLHRLKLTQKLKHLFLTTSAPRLPPITHTRRRPTQWLVPLSQALQKWIASVLSRSGHQLSVMRSLYSYSTCSTNPVSRSARPLASSLQPLPFATPVA